MKEVLIQELPKEERPRERLVEHGAEYLSNTELLAILLRTGTKNCSAISMARAILKHTEGLKHLNDISIHELTEVEGIGIGKATQLLASIELGKRISRSLTIKQSKLQTIKTPEDCFALLGDEMKYLQQEHFVVLSLDVRQKLLAKDTVFVGALDVSLVHPREIFHMAVKRMAASIICVHNHPGGSIEPSLEDVMMTKQLVEASIIMEIPLLDHIIIGKNDYSSLKAYGHI